MNVGLFIPCYVDQFYPNVAIATLELLEKLGCNVSFPDKVVCCGQPMANSGFAHLGKQCDVAILDGFAGVDYIVCPSGSCTLHVKDHLHHDKREHEAQAVRNRIYELTEFITDILKVDNIPAYFPHRVGMHQSCHGQRGLHTSQMTELVAEPFSKPLQLLRGVEGLELVELTRKDECCGFGGTFSVMEEAVSSKMGKDRVRDHETNGAEFIVGIDMSCLMHMEGILKRKKSVTRIVHIAEILNHSR